MKVLLVDDSALIRNILSDLLHRIDNILLEEASNGRVAFEKNLVFKPDLIIMDINMPVMDGLDATARIMQSRAVPIIILSNEIDAYNSFKAFDNGAFDVIKKPDLYALNDPEFVALFIERVGLIAKVKFTKNEPHSSDGANPHGLKAQFQIMVIGASAGGPLAVKEVLSRLPANFPLGIVVVQHLEAGFEKGYADWLGSETKVKVTVAENNHEVKAGNVFIAPAGKHVVVKGLHLGLYDGPKVLNQKPSINVLFDSAAIHYGERSLGLLLTGMGSDGAKGCLNILQHGGYTIIQDPASCAVYGMPKAAIELQAATKIIPLNKIAPFILRLVGVRANQILEAKPAKKDQAGDHY
jgi:two-component system chemotaxis response regulator CheB